MARNGTDFGIQIAAHARALVHRPRRAWWRGSTSPASPPTTRNPDIGDSTITETAGYGGFAMAAAPAIVQFVGGTPQMALDATREMYEITLSEHEGFTIPLSNFRGTPPGIDLRKVVETGILPRINTGIAHKEPGVGMVGAGSCAAGEMFHGCV